MAKGFLYLVAAIILIAIISLTFNYINPWLAWFIVIVVVYLLFRSGDNFLKNQDKK